MLQRLDLPPLAGLGVALDIDALLPARLGDRERDTGDTPLLRLLLELGELLAELKDISDDAKTPAACRNEIDAALSRDESDIGKLTALLEKARTARR